MGEVLENLRVRNWHALATKGPHGPSRFQTGRTTTTVLERPQPQRNANVRQTWNTPQYNDCGADKLTPRHHSSIHGARTVQGLPPGVSAQLLTRMYSALFSKKMDL